MPAITEDIKALLERARDGERIVLHHVNWEFYEALLEEIGNRRVFVTYDEGELEIMPPLMEHEDDVEFITDLLKIVFEELEIDTRTLGSTTWRRRDMDCGLEADQCFYIQNYHRVPLRKQVDLENDPPPDLAVESDLTRSSRRKDSVYVKLGVPELWICKKGRLTFYRLQSGKYVEQTASVALPMITPSDMERFLKLFTTTPPLEAKRKFRQWVRKKLQLA